MAKKKSSKCQHGKRPWWDCEECAKTSTYQFKGNFKTASPLPVPPPALVKTGAMSYSETWLFTNDSKWRLPTLTVPQE